MSEFCDRVYGIAVLVSGDQPTADEIAIRVAALHEVELAAAVEPWRTLVQRAVDDRIDDEWLNAARALLAKPPCGTEGT
jgi:hypothetical protein